MGVISCGRNGCTEIMCNTYIDGVGYVCSSCQKEFRKYLEYKKVFSFNESEIKKELLKFMETELGDYETGKEMTIEEYFRKYS